MNTPSKWLLYGHRGWIGQQFVDYIHKNQSNVEIIGGEARADQTDDFINEIQRVHPDRVISFIGRTHGEGFSTIDYLEQPGKLVDNIRDNLFSPLQMAIICKKYNIHFTYLGTGCIFEYDADHTMASSRGFVEEDVPNFFGSSYSIVKGYTDRLMHLFDDSVLQLRIRMPIVNYHNDRNFITKITRYNKVINMPNSMTALPLMYPIIADMIKNGRTGTINLTNPGVISHNEILEKYRQYVDSDFQWTNFTIEEQNEILASKRSNNLLDTRKLEEYYPDVFTIHEAIDYVFQNWITP
jgi:dTDP-4-dehydrorhamnose reductase